MSMKIDQEHFRGCLIGGAIGDAFGWPVEFLQLDAIKQKYGEAGITGLVNAESGAITHGHPYGYLSAGALAYIIDAIIEGSDLFEAVSNAKLVLKEYAGHEECYTALTSAVDLAESDLTDTEAIKKLGEGWVGEEALAIAVYCRACHIITGNNSC